MQADTDIAIVGGGLSGLALAESLTRNGASVRVFEARARPGGRILSRSIDGDAGPYDMGPAWIWPHNRRMLDMLRRLDLRVFEQFATGRLVFQEADGTTRRDLNFAPMAGALRVDGGLGAVIDALIGRLPKDTLAVGHRVNAIAVGDGAVDVTGMTASGPFTARAAKVVLAPPPRVLATAIQCTPALPDALVRAFRNTPTWMAGHAKLIAVYARPFWRDQGLSGDAISHRGPLAEIHDASPADGGAGALFGFVGTPPDQRATAPDAVKSAAVAQLADLFGPDAAAPVAVLWQDWAVEPETAVPDDRVSPAGHPAYGPPAALSELGTDRLLFAGTELAPEEGGFLEGALAASAAAAKMIQR